MSIPSQTGLTWQGQGARHNLMDSTPQVPNRLRGIRPFSEGRPELLSTPEHVEEIEENRLGYWEPQVQRRPGIRSPLESLTDDDVRRLFVEALDWSTLACPVSWPLPPAGLPGKVTSTYDRYEGAADLIRLGMDYMKAAIRGEARTMHNRWQQSRDLIDKLVERGRDEAREAAIAEMVSREMPIVPQKVYFIASESGPIKIGIAVNPINRLKGLQTGHHEKLSLLATCDGGGEQERAYHAQFATCRLHGEWFERHPEILAEIERLSA